MVQAWQVVVFVLFSGSAVLKAQTSVPSATVNNQLLWQISGKGLSKPSYLFGSYHSNDPRVFKLSDSTYAALLSSEGIVIEADMYQLFSLYDMRLDIANLKFDSQGKPFTSDKNATKTKYGSEDGRPQFLDLYFQQLGYNMGKKVAVLETIEEQLDAFESVYERTETQKNLEQLKIIQDNLLNAYLKGDIERVLSIVQNQLSESKNAFDRLIIKRNHKMADGIDTLIRKKSLFVAIGAAHLAGQEGVLQLLRKKGYNVRQVVAGFSSVKTEAELKLTSFNKHLYQDKKYPFTAVFGGKPVRDSAASNYRLVYQEMGQGNTYIIEIETLFEDDLSLYIKDVIDPPEKSKIAEIKHQNAFIAYEGIGYEYGAGLSWKRVFVYQNKLVKLICFGGNKFMNSNRPQAFFEKVIFELK